MAEPKITYDVNSHIFYTYTRNGIIDPVSNIIVYDGGNLEEINIKDEAEEDDE